MPMKPPEMILFDYGLTVSYLTGKGSVGPNFRWILFCWRKLDRVWNFSQCDFSHGVSNPSDIYSVVGLELNFHMKWTRWLFFRWHILTFHRYIFLYYIPTGLIVVTSWIFFLLPSTSYPARFSTRFSKDHWKYSDRTALLVTVFLLLINIFSGVVNDTPNTNDGRKNPLILQLFYSFLPISIIIFIYDTICRNDRLGVLDFHVHRLGLSLPPLLWRHFDQGPDDHTGKISTRIACDKCSSSWPIPMIIRWRSWSIYG